MTVERKLARDDALVALHRLRRALGARADASRIDMLAAIVEQSPSDAVEHELAVAAATLFPNAPDLFGPSPTCAAGSRGSNRGLER